MAKIILELYSGAINTGDQLLALGMYDKDSNTVVVADQGNFIKTSPRKITVVGTVRSGGDTTSTGGPPDTPRKLVYQIQKDDGTFINVSYTAYPPSAAGDTAGADTTLSLYEGSILVGDYMKAYGTYDIDTNTIVVADEGDYIKTYPPEFPQPE
jgi:hypothetical protein